MQHVCCSLWARCVVLMEHRPGFSSEAMVLISCSLNVIMVMITEMTLGVLGGNPWLIHPHTWVCCDFQMRTADWAGPGGPSLLFLCPLSAWMRWVNDQIHSRPGTQNLKGHEREKEMDTFCCLTIDAVFQSNYLSLLQPLLLQSMALKPAGVQTSTRMWWIRCLVSSLPPTFIKIHDTCSHEMICNSYYLFNV